MSSKYFVNGRKEPFDSHEEAVEYLKMKKALPYVDRLMAKGSHESKARMLLDIVPTIQKEILSEDLEKEVKEYIEI